MRGVVVRGAPRLLTRGVAAREFSTIQHDLPTLPVGRVADCNQDRDHKAPWRLAAETTKGPPPTSLQVAGPSDVHGRRMGDSNPRGCYTNTLSKCPPGDGGGRRGIRGCRPGR